MSDQMKTERKSADSDLLKAILSPREPSDEFKDIRHLLWAIVAICGLVATLLAAGCASVLFGFAYYLMS